MAVRKRMAEDETGHDRDNVIDAPITPRRLTVSEILRDRRIECGFDIAHIATVLRIRQPILAAIEDGRFDELPGPAYSVGFIRSYATYLGLDAEALVARFKMESDGAASRPRLYFPLPVRDSHVPTGPLLLICLLLAVLIYGGWYYVNAGPDRLADWVPPVPDRLRHMLGSERPAPARQTAAVPQPAPAEAASAQGPAQPASPAPAQTASVQQPAQPQTAAPQPAPAAAVPAATPAQTAAAAQPQPAVDGAPPVESKSAPAPAAPPPAPDLAQPAVSADAAKSAPAAATTYGGPEAQSRVVLKANADSWIQVRDSNSNLLFTRVLKPGETYNVPNQPGLTMVAGNAGGLDIAVDGMDIPRLGESGHVVRNVSLDPDRLLGAARHAN